MSGNTVAMDGRRDHLVQQVLQDLTYPAEKWQIVTQAELYGADVTMREELHELPMREYGNMAEIAEALNGNGAKDGSGTAQQT